jgi:hypothetical protein
MVPTRAFFTKGVGVHKNKLQSFELALRAAGIEKQNLVYVSSIYPPNCELLSLEDGVKALHPGQVTFCDCSAESPAGRRSACYDAPARVSRKENAPESSALEAAASMGIDLLTEAQYRALQALGEFDTKTSSWIETPADVRALGGALFCDRRYGKVFVYHNGAQSYYAARGFRGSRRV